MAATYTAEYKQVTVLFADVVGSMDIAATLDPERWREVITDLVERSAAAVHRYGGTAESTGDGIMAVFGAPIALEDHAFRACLAGLAIQKEAARLATDVQNRDSIDLRLRVGLNSGRVIAGEFGSGSLGYRATGSTVGYAQRMESAAPPGGVLLSESTASLVEHLALLSEAKHVRIKGTDQLASVRRLLGIRSHGGLAGRVEATLVGRRCEIEALEALVDMAVDGRGGLVTVVGPPGIGKSRIARETAALAGSRGVDVVWAYCESHARDVPFNAVTRVLGAATGIVDLDDEAARAHVRQQYPAADPQDLLLLDDLLGIADPAHPQPAIDPETRQRRLTALVTSAAMARTRPALMVIEDAHWMDTVSEAMLSEYLAVVSRTATLVLITARPEYRGTLGRVPEAQTIALAPLRDSDTAALLGELLGSDHSIGELAAIIAERAAGNPFFAEEMVRELAQRGVLNGDHGRYSCDTSAAEVTVPATVQAAIEARIDKLDTAAKRTLNAASVIGARFDAGLLAALGVNAVVDELLGTELVDQVRFTSNAEYAFRHPLIRAVAYESQLKSDRAQWHRRLAAAIQERAPGSADENAALIAGHLGAAGELPAAYGWHMRAAAWSTNRDVDAARVSWERAQRIADALPDDDPNHLSMRIAPRTMLCATDYKSQTIQESRSRFEDLRKLCSAAGDKVSLAIGTSGLAAELQATGHSREGAELVSEQMAVLDSIGDPTLTMGLAFVGFNVWADAGEFGEVLRWSQTVIDLAAGDPAKGASFGFGSPLAIALAWRSNARWWLGLPGWREDLHDAVAMARNSDPATFAGVVAWTYNLMMDYGVLGADEAAVHVCEEAVHAAGSSNDVALLLAEYALAVVLLSRDDAADRRRGLDLTVQLREYLRERWPFLVPVIELWAARETARRGDRDAAIAVMRQAVDELLPAGRLAYGVWGCGVLVEALLERGADGDLAEAHEAIDRLANVRADQDSAVREITLLRLRARLASARGDGVAYRDLANRYRAMAESLGFEGHIAWAQAML